MRFSGGERAGTREKGNETRLFFSLKLRLQREDVWCDKRCHMRVSRTNFAWVFIYPRGINRLRKLALILYPCQYTYIYVY